MVGREAERPVMWRWAASTVCSQQWKPYEPYPASSNCDLPRMIRALIGTPHILAADARSSVPLTTSSKIERF